MAKNDTRSEHNTIGNESTHASNETLQHKSSASNETLQHKSSANSEHNKSLGWYTAFYRYAEFLRNITSGAINHKNLYAYVGLNGRYVNNPNPRLRKRRVCFIVLATQSIFKKVCIATLTFLAMRHAA